MSTPSKKRSYGLDLMRALAICLVLLAHFAKKIEFLGFWGVEIFFALSGFLIGDILWRSYSQTDQWNSKYLLNFWKRRWWRTIPNYYLFFIVSIVFALLVYGELPVINKLITYLWFGQNLIWPNETFYGVSWSLCIEEWFYLSFPALLFILAQFKLKKTLTYSITLFLFIALAVTSRYILLYFHDEKGIRGITFARLDAIAYGVALSFLIAQITLRTQIVCLLAFMGVILMCSPAILAFANGMSYEELEYNGIFLALVPLGAAFTLPFLKNIKEPEGIFSIMVKPVTKLSLWSYSIYLSHIPFLYLGYFLLENYRSSFLGNFLSKFLGLVLTLIVSALLFKYFEKPFTKMRPSELKPEASRTAGTDKKDKIGQIPPI